MKKTISILVIILILITALCGCSNTSTKPNTEDTSAPAVDEKIDISIFPEVEASHANLKVYREEVNSRLNNLEEGDSFITEDEWNVIQNEWDSTDYNIRNKNFYITAFNSLYEESSKYYYPVVFREEDSLIMWYTTESGSVLLKKVLGNWNSSNYAGSAHSDDDSTAVLLSHQTSKVIYTQETGEVTYWNFGKKLDTVAVPKGSVYCGKSHFEGYLFRSGYDVYALRTGMFKEGKTVECIAHNVKYVIDADYNYGSDPWSQPLFIMTDGSIKAYISWNGDKNAPADDISHLCDLQYEGGWNK